MSEWVTGVLRGKHVPHAEHLRVKVNTVILMILLVIYGWVW